MTQQESTTEAIRRRAQDTGLVVDEARLGTLAEAWPGVEAMVTTLSRAEIDPLDLALDPFDPAWTGLERRR